MDIKKVLVVDDDEGSRKLFARQLETHGYEFALAADGMEALEMVRTFAPDLILMDIVLPDMDGPEVIARIKRNPLARDIPIICISGIVGTEDFHQKNSEVLIGQAYYPAIPKPIHFDDLWKRIQQIASEDR